MLSKRYLNRAIVLLHDIFAIPAAWLLAYWLRFNLATIPHDMFLQSLNALFIVIPIQVAAYWQFGLYRGIWRFASLSDLIRIIKAALVGTSVIFISLFFYNRLEAIPRSIIPLYLLILITVLSSSRLFYRLAKNNIKNLTMVQRVLVVGAGQAGEGLVRDLLRDISSKYKPVGFIDDDRNKIGHDIHGIRVHGPIKNIVNTVVDYSVDLIIIAIPSASSTVMRHIVNCCEEAGIPFRTLPGLKDLATGRVSINALREVSIEDLLGREPVSLNWQEISKSIKNKIVLISGGGGSIGSELCRQLAKLEPLELIIIEQNEFNLYSIQLELQQKFSDLQFHSYLIDVCDTVAVKYILTRHKPEIIFHAAAYKHVPLLESQLRIAIKNNVIGTKVLAEGAAQYHVKKFVLISTDKAVNPTNVMGATKRAAETFCQNLNSHSNTCFITVRFGNVLDSAGSVVPLFRKQIAQGGPVTVTHPEITRYFMTIPEASQLILQATVFGKGSEIFVLDMGEPIKIRYLAEQMVKLSGLKLNEDIIIQYTGLRPGEKLYEELFHASEELVSTTHQKILQAKYRAWDWNKLSQVMDEIIIACDNYNESALQNYLLTLVPEYNNKDLLLH